MRKLWRRWARGDDGLPSPEAFVDRRNHDTRPSDEELEARLAAVTPRWARPPSPEELRSAFGRRQATGTDEPAPAEGASTERFAERFTEQSLFTATATEAPFEDEPGADDRSRTNGNYYYDPEDAWAVLGLQAAAPWADVTAAHRRLAMEHHPDRLHAATADERASSERTMREINVAYSVLRRLTGH